MPDSEHQEWLAARKAMKDAKKKDTKPVPPPPPAEGKKGGGDGQDFDPVLW